MPAAPTLDMVYKTYKSFESAINTFRDYLKGIGSVITTREDEARIVLPMDKVDFYMDTETLLLKAGGFLTINYTSDGGSLEARIFADDHIINITITSGMTVSIYTSQGSIVVILRLSYISQGTRVIINKFARENPG